MPVPTKFDMKDAVSLDQAPPAKFDVSGAVEIGSPEDLSTPKEPGKEGVYQMFGKKPTKENPDAVGQIAIPYSRVPEAMSSGYTWYGGSGETYAKDKEAEGKTPSITGQIDEKVQKSLEPVANPAMTPGLMPIQNTNQLRAAARVAYGLPGYVGDLARTWEKVATKQADPSELVDMVDPGQVPANLYHQFKTDWQKDKQLAVDNLIGSLVGIMGVGKATEAGAKVAKTAAEKLPTALPEVVRGGVRDTLGVPQNTEKLTEKFGKKSEQTRRINQRKEDLTEKGKGQVDEARIKAAKKYQDDLEEHAKNVTTIRGKHAEDKFKRELANEKLLHEHRQETKAAQHNNLQAQKDHFAALEKISRDKQAAQGIENQRATMQQQIDDQSTELGKRIDDARVKAKADDDAAWDVVRQKTAGTEADLGQLQSVVEAAQKSADPATSAIFKSILKEGGGEAGKPVMIDGKEIDHTNRGYNQLYEATYGEPPPVNSGGAGKVNFDRLQRWYTYLNDKIYGGGRLEAGSYKALKSVRDAIDREMTGIAKSVGALDELKKARSTHTERMEAFHDSPNEKQTVATAYEKGVTPEATREATLEERGAKLGKYDPEIPKIGESLTQARESIKKLPSSDETRKMMSQEVPQPPVPGPLPPHPELKPAIADPDIPEPPKMPDEIPYAEPKGTLPLPEAPDIHEQNLKLINDRLRQYGKIGAWVLRLIVGGAQEALTHGHLSVFGHDILLGQAGVTVLTHALRSPSVLDWLARPSEEDIRTIESLPPKDAQRMKDVLGGLALDEKNRNPEKANSPIHPALAAFLASGSTGHPPQKPDQPAQQPPDQSGATHYFDEASGTILPVQ